MYIAKKSHDSECRINILILINFNWLYYNFFLLFFASNNGLEDSIATLGKKIAYFGVIFLIELNLQKNISEMEGDNMIHSTNFDTKKE